MGGDVTRKRRVRKTGGLNPPRPHGRGQSDSTAHTQQKSLKSTPPAWAGTQVKHSEMDQSELKSTPPAWAGTFMSPLV